jgi:hypothetical protein
MTHEERIYISVEDIQEIELQCKNCSGRLSFDARPAAFPDRCPLCTEEWFKRTSQTDTRKMYLFDLSDRLMKIRESFKEVGCTLAFRIASKPD